MTDKIRVFIEIFPPPVRNIELAISPENVVKHMSGLINCANFNKVSDDSAVKVEALYPRLKFNILPEDFFFYWGKELDEPFVSDKPLVRSIFVPANFRGELNEICCNSKSTDKQDGFEIRISAFPYNLSSDQVRKEYDSSAKAADNEKGFGGFLCKTKYFFKHIW